MKTIQVAKVFSRYPAGRSLADGPYSGELFRTKYLKPALAEEDSIVVDLDGTRGYGSSFLEEAFGGLVRKEGFSKDDLRKKLEIRATNGSLCKEIHEYIEKAEPESA